MPSNVKNLRSCRACFSKNLYRFLDLGKMPIPNGFLKKDDLKIKEEQYELACFFCEDCGLVQLTNVVNPYTMFSNYLYIPSTSKVMLNNFSNLAYQAYKDLNLSSNSLVIDIGSNDGSLLTFFKSLDVKVLGIDPAKNLAKVAQLKGIPTEAKLFNLNTAKAVRQKYGSAKLITATNVVAHVDNLHELLKGIDHLLSSDGHFITEFPYLLDLIQKNEFDTIYHEHLSYFSLLPWVKLITSYGFEIVGVERLLIHGGSIRLRHRRRKRSKEVLNTLNYLVALEQEQGLYKREAFDDFSNRVYDLKRDLIHQLKELKKKNKTIVGYGAAAKGNVLLNFLGIDKRILTFIVDSTSYKQGLYTPGTHIPIYAENRLDKNVDYALILAWNFADEIMEKQKQFKKRGGKFIIPIPKVKII